MTTVTTDVTTGMTTPENQVNVTTDPHNVVTTGNVTTWDTTTTSGLLNRTTTSSPLEDSSVVGYIALDVVNSTGIPDLFLYNSTINGTSSTLEPWPDPGLDICANISNSSTVLDHSLADIHHVVAGGVIFAVILPLVLFDFRVLPIGTTSAVLLGAMMMVLTRVVSQDEVYQVVGRRENITMLFALLAMMLMIQYIEREQMLVRVLRRFLKAHHSFENYIWRICLLSFVLSAIFSSDASCAVLTPVVLKFWEVQERPRAEQGCILLAIATSANIGSVVTVFGGPHLALIAARTAAPLYGDTRIDMRVCVMYLLPPALVAFLMNLAFLVLHYRLRNGGFNRSNLISEPSSQCEQEMMAGFHRENNNQKHHQNGFLRLERNDPDLRDERIINPCQLETILEDEILEISSNSPSIGAREGANSPGVVVGGGADIVQIENDSDGEDEEEEDEDHGAAENESSLSRENRITYPGIQVEYRPSALQASRSQSFGQLGTGSDTSLSRSLEQHGLKLSQKVGVYRSIGAVSAVDFLPPDAGLQQMNHSISCQSVFSPGDSSGFQVVLTLLIVGVLALLLASTEAVPFDMGLVPMGAAILAILADSILNRRPSSFVLKRVDWSIIIMFFGIFIWIQGLNNTRLPRWLWEQVGLADSHVLGLSPEVVAIACLVVVLGSTLFGQVPLTLMVLDQLVPCADQLWLVLLLAWCATIAGNLTLFNSVANLIVVQKAAKTVRYRLTFCSHLQFGFLTTLILIPVGVLILYGLLLIPV